MKYLLIFALMILPLVGCKNDTGAEKIHSGKTEKLVIAAVLEINGGIANKLGIKKGDIVKHRFFDN